MSKLGLVFSGGGGKGAYEIGVYKALQEYGVDKNIEAVSGTSVGALNGALFAKGDLALAIDVWQTMSPERILQLNPMKVVSVLSKLHVGSDILASVGKKLGFLKSEGVFTQKGLESIIRDSLNEGELSQAIPFYICATDVSNKLSLKPLYKKLNYLTFETQVAYLLATSAIPVAFPTTIVEDVELLDGFLTDNTPVKPLIEDEGCDTLIVVLLGRGESIREMQKKYPHVKIWEIVPTEDTKESLGSLDFKTQTAHKLIEMGYSDTKKTLHNLHEFIQTEKEFLQKGSCLQQQEEVFVQQVQEPLSLESGIKQLEVKLEEHQKQLIENGISTILDKMQNNSLEFSKLAFEAVTTLSATTGKINYQQEQGSFFRLIGLLNGSNHQHQADINQNFHNAIYANTQLIKKLAQRENLTLDVCLSLGNKINFLAKNQHKLALQNQQQVFMLEELKNSILTLAQLTKDAISSNTQRIEKLEYGQTLLNWSHHLKSSIQGLNHFDAIMKVVGGYYAIIKDVKEKNSNFLYSALVNVELDDIEIEPLAFIEYVQKKEQLPLFEQIQSDEVLPFPKSYEAYAPIFASLSYMQEQPTIQAQKIVEKFSQNYNLDIDVVLDGTSFAFELLSGLELSAQQKGSLEKAKKSMDTKLTTILKCLEKDDIQSFRTEIETLRLKIQEFKVVVPLIGKFSSGKSKLLNTYIAKDEKLFAVDTNPTTAVATEIHYAPQKSVEVYKDGDKVLYEKHFLNYPKLKNRADLVLVDMPGFESSNLQHNDAINHYFNKGEHYIIALSCESTNDKSILKHIKEIHAYGAQYSLLLTKIDKKLPQDIKQLKTVLKQNIDKLYSEDVFIGSVSAFRDDLEDFEQIVDTVYADGSKIFTKRFTPLFKELTNKVVTYYTKLLHTPQDDMTLDKEYKKEQKEFERNKQTLQTELKTIRLDLVQDGSLALQKRANDILEANISFLIKSAKNKTLSLQVTEMLRPPLNATLKNLLKTALQKVDTKNLATIQDIEFSFSPVEIDTTLSWWDEIVNFFYNTQDEKIETQLREQVLPKIAYEVYKNAQKNLESIYCEIVQSVGQKIAIDEKTLNQLQKELKKQMAMQEEKLKQQHKELQKSLKVIGDEL